jgi:hypothetical protein
MLQVFLFLFWDVLVIFASGIWDAMFGIFCSEFGCGNNCWGLVVIPKGGGAKERPINKDEKFIKIEVNVVCGYNIFWDPADKLTGPGP